MKDLKVYVNEFMEYKLSEGRDAEKTIGRYITYIKEAFEYLNINTLEDLNNIKYPTIKMNWVNKKIEEGWQIQEELTFSYYWHFYSLQIYNKKTKCYTN